jgi:hypothetical protein
MIPTPDPATWSSWAIAAFEHREAGLELARLAVFALVTAFAIAIVLLAIAAAGVLRK